MIEILLALIAGILTIAAPCILLPLPILLGSSVGQKNKARPLFITGGFVITFAVLGIAINFIVQNLGVSPNTIRNVGAVLLALFAVFMIWPTPFEKLTAHLTGLINKAGQTSKEAGTGNFGGFVTGVVIGIVWAPCAGPILASILTLIAQEQNTGKAIGLLVAYSIGAGIPMLAIAYGGQAVTTKIKGIAKYATRLQQIFGCILLVLAVAIYFQYDTKLQTKILDKLPSLGGNIESSLFCKLDSYASKHTECTSDADKAQGTGYVQAPEFVGITNWLNTDKPLALQDLKGKVVLIDFWTYSCINCIRTLPYVTKWYDTYKDQGFVVIGVHTPEFAFEKETDNVAKAIKQFGIHYPVAQDNNYGTWTAYNNHYWPAHYLLNKDGAIVETHFGEGNYDKTEEAIQQLLGMHGPLTEVKTDGPGKAKTPETYFGYSRQELLSNGRKDQAGVQEFVIPNYLAPNKFALGGMWDIQPEKIVLAKNNGTIKLHFNAGKVHLVAASPKAQSITVRVDNYPARVINIQDASLYTLFDTENYGDHVLEITIPEAGFEGYTFTFG